MSNLSELLPAGGSAKEFEAVASGTLPNGKPVILKANGQVEAVGESSSGGIQIPAGLPTSFNTNVLTFMDIAYNPNVAGQFVVVYRDNTNNGYFTANLGTVSGTGITFGSNVIIFSATIIYCQIKFDPNTANRFVVAGHNETSSNRGTAWVGTVSGSSLSFSDEMFWNGGSTGIFLGFDFDPNQANRFVAAFYNGNNSNYGTLVVGSVSSATNINYASQTVFESSYSASDRGVSFDPNTSGKFVIAWRDASTSPSYGGSALIGTLSGTSFSFGSKATFVNSGTTQQITVNYDPNTAGKFLITYRDAATTKGTAIIGTVSGTTISYGSAVDVNTGSDISYVSAAFDPATANKFVAIYKNKAKVGTISGNTISFGSAYTLPSAAGGATSSYRGTLAVAFDTSANDGRFVTINKTYTGLALDGGQAALSDLSGTVVTTNVANFVGTSTAAFTNGQTATIVPKGGVSANQSSLTIGSTYYVQGNGTVSTVSTSPAVILGKAISSTSVILKGNS